MSGLFDSFDLSAVTKPTTTKKAKKTEEIKKEKPKGHELTNQGLFSDEFNIELNKPQVNVLLDKLSKSGDATGADAAKVLKSKSLSLEERLELIKTKVLEVLGKQRKNVIVIKTKEEFEDYVTKAIEFGRVAVDTETNNSLDPVTCKLMGLCLYSKGQKQAYVPINHRDPFSGEHLTWQLTEEDCREQLQRFKDTGTFIVMHNGKFDYEVINCTCNIKLNPDWDTIIAARLLNENEPAGLKWQYVTKIDPTQEKYDIENLFENVAYADVDPEIFALYAARDAGMTDELYELQYSELYSYVYEQVCSSENHELIVDPFVEVETPTGYVKAKELNIGDYIRSADGTLLKINKKIDNFNKIYIYYLLN